MLPLTKPYCSLRRSSKLLMGVIWKKFDALAQAINGGDIKVDDLLEVMQKFTRGSNQGLKTG